MWKQRRWQDRPLGERPAFDVDDEAVEAAISRTRQSGETKMSEGDALSVLEAYRIPVTPWRVAPEPECESAAEGLGYPLALKIVSPDIVHKTEYGAVVLGIESRTELRERLGAALAEVRRHFTREAQPRIRGILLQKMAPKGREIIAGLTRVPRVGPMVMFGLGGIYVEALRDVSLRMCPITDEDARNMVREVKMHRLLEAIRGEGARDVDALADVLLRLSQLALRHAAISEMDVNPLVSLPKGAVAVDARIQLASPPAPES
jgi:acyl-CoA synthetase (NDP forming)